MESRIREWPEKDHNRLKVIAVEGKVSMNALLIQIVSEWLESHDYYETIRAAKKAN